MVRPDGGTNSTRIVFQHDPENAIGLQAIQTYRFSVNCCLFTAVGINFLANQFKRMPSAGIPSRYACLSLLLVIFCSCIGCIGSVFDSFQSKLPARALIPMGHAWRAPQKYDFLLICEICSRSRTYQLNGLQLVRQPVLSAVSCCTACHCRATLATKSSVAKS